MCEYNLWYMTKSLKPVLKPTIVKKQPTIVKKQPTIVKKKPTIVKKQCKLTKLHDIPIA